MLARWFVVPRKGFKDEALFPVKRTSDRRIVAGAADGAAHAVGAAAAGAWG